MENESEQRNGCATEFQFSTKVEVDNWDTIELGSLMAKSSMTLSGNVKISHHGIYSSFSAFELCTEIPELTDFKLLSASLAIMFPVR